ncbi:hypothetical protein [Burkholderia sp. ABCPW 14]|uniref:hypothetical protein n=1 Tax=Burkholderia sp. ABCPW 14 TaxID=1637860 RepID=UPI0018D24FA5|nr:hypothetical protein [Burkholderia sp. ABCPW 14]
MLEDVDAFMAAIVTAADRCSARAAFSRVRGRASQAARAGCAARVAIVRTPARCVRIAPIRMRRAGSRYLEIDRFDGIAARPGFARARGAGVGHPPEKPAARAFSVFRKHFGRSAWPHPAPGRRARFTRKIAHRSFSRVFCRFSADLP